MSTTLQKRTWAQAREDAEAFRALFPPACYQRWEFAGSVRRRRPEVADVEHVIIPSFGDVERGEGLFVVPERVNLLFFHLDCLVRGGQVTKHIYGATGYRWGDKYRGADFRGFNHELFLADRENWGSVLAIRTGPAEFSKRIVMSLQRNGYVNHGSYVKSKSHWQCPNEHRTGTPRWFKGPVRGAFVRDPDGRDNGPESACCPVCVGDVPTLPVIVPAPDEREYFKLAGIPFVEPERR